MEANPMEATPEERQRSTRWLIVAGAVSLLLPLLGALYLRWTESSKTQGPSGRSDVFERHDALERRVVPSQTVVPSAALTSPIPASRAARPIQEPYNGSSLDFIKPNAEMTAKVADQKSAAIAATNAAAPSEVKPAETGKTAAKKGKKDFTKPKLHPSRGFQKMGAGTRSEKGSPLLKDLPPGAENDPQVQAYLKNAAH